MISFSKRHNEMPQLNTSALPDLIFAVLFFFMIVTHMRNMPPILHYQVPQGKELSKAKSRQAIYIAIDKDGKVQLGSDIVPVESIAELLKIRGIAQSAETDDDDPENQQQAILRADRQAPMYVVKAVKQQLRAAGCLRITYTGTKIEK